jgi:polysaccharide biosynthesis transport protein
MSFIKDYLSPLFKWWWLVIVAPIIAAGSAFLFARQLPPVYQARTTLLIGRAIQDPNPSGTEFGLSYQLAAEYANMAMREPVMNAAKAALGLSELPKYEANARGIFLEIAVLHTDPRFAQAVANVLAQQLILLSPVNTQHSSGNDSQFVQQQLTELQESIESTRQEITKKQEDLSKFNSALDVARTNTELKALEDKSSTLQTLYTQLFASTREAAFNTLSVFDPASLPTTPIGPRTTLIVLLAAASGLAFAVGAAYLIEFMDDTIKASDEITRLVNVPTIGYIGEMQGYKPTFVASQPRSPVADAFRGLRTNLEFMSVDHPMKKLAICSAEASDGKSTVAINLAIVMAQSEKKVILLDADLRSPVLHKYLDIPENPGLSDVFLDRVKIQDVLVEWSGTPKFKIIAAGSTPPNSAELLGSRKMDQILDELSEMADIIILDGPPGFVVDAVVLSSKVDGVLLVINMGETRRGPIKAVVEQFQRVDANLVGVVLNRITKGSAYYGTYYHSSYYSKEPVTRPIPSNLMNKSKWGLKSFSAKYLSRFLPKKKTFDVDQLNRVLNKAPVISQPIEVGDKQPESFPVSQMASNKPEAVQTAPIDEKQPEDLQIATMEEKQPKVVQTAPVEEKILEAAQVPPVRRKHKKAVETIDGVKNSETVVLSQANEALPTAGESVQPEVSQPENPTLTMADEQETESLKPIPTKAKRQRGVRTAQKKELNV